MSFLFDLWPIVGLSLLFIVLSPLFAVVYLIQLVLRLWHPAQPTKKHFAFYHPYADAGGGGEKVLWHAVRAIFESDPRAEITLYWPGGVDHEAIMRLAERVNRQFAIAFSEEELQRFHLSRIYCVSWAEAHTYLRFTLLGQFLGSFFVGIACMFTFGPTHFVDTIGCPGMYPAVWLFSSARIIAYVHYPTVSIAMLSTIAARKERYNHAAFIASSRILSFLKYTYYAWLLKVYSHLGSYLHVAMANSSWTLAHMRDLWTRCDVVRVYPPCVDASSVQIGLPLEKKRNSKLLVSLAGFRPEKNHALQLEALAALRARYQSHCHCQVVFVGAVRGDRSGDLERVEALEQLCEEHNLSHARVDCRTEVCPVIPHNVTCLFWLNAARPHVLHLLESSSIGLHSMVDEHFGICLVEYMHAGCIPLAHNSGGPKEDIVQDGKNGFLAETVEEYADSMARLLSMSDHDMDEMRLNGKSKAFSFSNEHFERAFVHCLPDFKNKSEHFDLH